MNRTLWTLKRMQERLGTFGLAGLGLVLLSATLQLSLVLAGREQAGELAQEVADLKASATQRGQVAQASYAGAPARKLQEFYKFFPASQDATGLVERIFALAHARGLDVVRADYSTSAHIEGKLLRHHISLPVRGNYPAIRRFVASTTGEIPAIALESIHFDSVTNGAVEAKVELVLFMRAPT
jgi:Tfp pilus assembly protein PilO